MELNNQPTRGAKHKKIKTLCQIAKQVPRAGAEKMKKAMKTAEEEILVAITEIINEKKRQRIHPPIATIREVADFDRLFGIKKEELTAGYMSRCDLNEQIFKFKIKQI